ncbi:hypothetical protein DFJ73DRAFT_843600 [Zopfochytrium polystomum]|nr:hypothetical protein DFJ73DRAFT_843600 [Zopfochytrium polystomum]
MRLAEAAAAVILASIACFLSLQTYIPQVQGFKGWTFLTLRQRPPMPTTLVQIGVLNGLNTKASFAHRIGRTLDWSYVLTWAGSTSLNPTLPPILHFCSFKQPPVRRSVDSLQTRHQHQQMLLVQQQLNQQQQQQQLLQLQSSGASSSQKRPKKKHFLHKTELCRTWRMFGSCPYGNKCQFAHSESELRFVTRHPKWKTALCKRYWMTGTCPFGDLCSFIHRLDESSIFKQGNLPLPVESSSRVMNVDSPQQQQQQHSMDRRSQMSQAMAWQIERSSNPSLPSSPRRSVEDPFPAFADFDDSQWFPDDAFYSDPTPTSVAVTEPTLAAGTAKPSPAHLSAHFPTEARRPPLPHSLSAASADRFRPTRRRSLSPDFANLLSPLSLHSTDDSGARLFPGGYPRSPATQTKASLSSQPPPPPSFSTLSLSPRRGLPLPTPSPSASSVQSSSLLQPPPGTMLAPTSASTHSDSTWLPPSFSSPPSVTNATKPRPGPPLRTSLSFSAAESGNLSVGWEAQQDSW